MRFLDVARETCDRYHPGLVKALDDVPFDELEKPGSSTAIDLFREHDGAALLVPKEFGGGGAGLAEATRVMRALGAASPSLAAAATMHHFTVATLYALAPTAGRLTAAQLSVLENVAPNRMLMASGWAEGRTEQNILEPTATADATEGGFVLNGSKKPCSLSRSMDLLTASIAVPGTGGEPELALALVPADSPGISVHPFWDNDVLAAAESDEVRLSDVFVADDLVVRTTPDDPHRLDDLQVAGFISFELLISSTYLGAASALIETVVERQRGPVTERLSLLVRIESPFAGIEGVARAVGTGELEGDAAVAAALVARFRAQEAASSCASDALELLGGMDFITSPHHARLASGARPLAFHPPSRTSTAEPLVAYFGGGPLELS
jgi:alkylation response protein AidB-like acyl-CoA dehydrogenase